MSPRAPSNTKAAIGVASLLLVVLPIATECILHMRDDGRFERLERLFEQNGLEVSLTHWIMRPRDLDADIDQESLEVLAMFDEALDIMEALMSPTSSRPMTSNEMGLLLQKLQAHIFFWPQLTGLPVNFDAIAMTALIEYEDCTAGYLNFRIDTEIDVPDHLAKLKAYVAHQTRRLFGHCDRLMWRSIWANMQQMPARVLAKLDNLFAITSKADDFDRASIQHSIDAIKKGAARYLMRQSPKLKRHHWPPDDEFKQDLAREFDRLILPICDEVLRTCGDNLDYWLIAHSPEGKWSSKVKLWFSKVQICRTLDLLNINEIAHSYRVVSEPRNLARKLLGLKRSVALHPDEPVASGSILGMPPTRPQGHQAAPGSFSQPIQMQNIATQTTSTSGDLAVEGDENIPHQNQRRAVNVDDNTLEDDYFNTLEGYSESGSPDSQAAR